jgi:hypothetical protein
MKLYSGLEAISDEFYIREKDNAIIILGTRAGKSTLSYYMAVKESINHNVLFLCNHMDFIRIGIESMHIIGENYNIQLTKPARNELYNNPNNIIFRTPKTYKVEQKLPDSITTVIADSFGYFMELVGNDRKIDVYDDIMKFDRKIIFGGAELNNFYRNLDDSWFKVKKATYEVNPNITKEQLEEIYEQKLYEIKREYEP